ncbi:MAG: response regulator transcription factor [Nocardioidaceae bacterium]
MASLMFVEDDEKIGRLVQSALRANGHQVTWQRTGASALLEVEQAEFDLVLLDLGLPDFDGVDVCRELKSRQPNCILVILTARHEEMDVVVGLEAGADDYLTKPFGLTELLARVRAHLRRGTTTTTGPALTFEIADLYVETGSRRCMVGGTEVSLRPKEFDLLVRLASEAGDVVSREGLMADVWDENWFGSTKTLDVHIAALRRRLADATVTRTPPVRVPSITTLRGRGYRLEPTGRV